MTYGPVAPQDRCLNGTGEINGQEFRTPGALAFITGDTADAVMNYMKAIEEAVKITDDINARYDAFANAEASLINNALVVPMGMSIPAYIATRLNYWEGQYASISSGSS